MTPPHIRAILEQFSDDLDDIASLRLGRFAQAHEADRMACALVQRREQVSPEQVIAVVEEWWNKYRPSLPNGPIEADLHTRLALVASIRYFARGGS